jgi:hypothetical protein
MLLAHSCQFDNINETLAPTAISNRAKRRALRRNKRDEQSENGSASKQSLSWLTPRAKRRKKSVALTVDDDVIASIQLVKENDERLSNQSITQSTLASNLTPSPFEPMLDAPKAKGLQPSQPIPQVRLVETPLKRTPLSKLVNLFKSTKKVTPQRDHNSNTPIPHQPPSISKRNYSTPARTAAIAPFQHDNKLSDDDALEIKAVSNDRVSSARKIVALVKGKFVLVPRAKACIGSKIFTPHLNPQRLTNEKHRVTAYANSFTSSVIQRNNPVQRPLLRAASSSPSTTRHASLIYTDHAKKRMIQRSIDPSSVKAAMRCRTTFHGKRVGTYVKVLRKKNKRSLLVVYAKEEGVLSNKVTVITCYWDN